MALSSAEAAKHFPLLSELLWRLAADKRTVVRRAACKAALNLAIRIPDEIAPLLDKWETDPQRSHISAYVQPKL